MDEWQKLKKAQEINRVILNEIKRVCEKYDICYYIDCGVLLGAVRHKSFIPWDDDVDISFTRENFEKFKKVIQVEWKDTGYSLIMPDDYLYERWLDNTIHINYEKEYIPRKIHSKLGEEAMAHIKLGGVIDVFILDNAPNNIVLHAMQYVLLVLDYCVLMGHRKYIDYKEYSLLMRGIVFVLSHIGRRISIKKLYALYEKHCRMCKKSKYYFYSNFSIGDMRKRNLKDWYGVGRKYSIDEDYYNGPDNYDEILKQNYGDYMQLPPEDMRVPKYLD